MQFLDCVHQLLCQHSTAFEFNHALLLATLDASYSCRFGTFLYNTERQRVEANIREKTVSFWTYVNAHRDDFINPCYRPHPHVIDVSVEARHVRWWHAMFDRHVGFAIRNERAVAKVMREQREQIESLWMQQAQLKTLIRALDEENAKLKSTQSL